MIANPSFKWSLNYSLNAEIYCKRMDGGCGLVFAAHVSRVVVVWILFVDVLDACHVDKCPLFHKHESKRISRHQASTGRQAMHVESRR